MYAMNEFLTRWRSHTCEFFWKYFHEHLKLIHQSCFGTFSSKLVNNSSRTKFLKNTRKPTFWTFKAKFSRIFKEFLKNLDAKCIIKKLLIKTRLKILKYNFESTKACIKKRSTYILQDFYILQVLYIVYKLYILQKFYFL